MVKEAKARTQYVSNEKPIDSVHMHRQECGLVDVRTVKVGE